MTDLPMKQSAIQLSDRSVIDEKGSVIEGGQSHRSVGAIRQNGLLSAQTPFEQKRQIEKLLYIYIHTYIYMGPCLLNIYIYGPLHDIYSEALPALAHDVICNHEEQCYMYCIVRHFKNNAHSELKEVPGVGVASPRQHMGPKTDPRRTVDGWY